MEWGENSIQLNDFLNPLIMADWLLDVDFELTTDKATQSIQSSLRLLKGEETVCFDTNHPILTGRGLVGHAELVEVSDRVIKVTFNIKERLSCGQWRTIMSPTLQGGMGGNSSFEINDPYVQTQAKLKMSIMSV
jgi:hypothetical protein